MKHHTKLFSLQLCYELIISALVTLVVGLLTYYIFIEPKTKVVLTEVTPPSLYPDLITPGETLLLNKRIFKYYSCPGEIVTTLRCGKWNYSYPTLAENFAPGLSFVSESYVIPQSAPRASTCTFSQTYWHTCNLVPIQTKLDPILFFTDFFSVPPPESLDSSSNVDAPSND